MVDTSLQVYVHISVITQVQIIIQFWQLPIIVLYTCLQLTPRAHKNGWLEEERVTL